MQGRESNSRHAGYGPAARPLSYPAIRIPPEGFEPSRARGPRRSERRAYAFRHGGMMAPAGIEPAPRWDSASRSTGELQEPSEADGTRTRTLPRDSRARWPLRYGSNERRLALVDGTTNE